MDRIDLSCVPEFISCEEQQALRELALNYLDTGVLQPNPRGPNRYRAKIWDTPYCTPLIKQVGERIVSHFQLAGYPVDPQLGWIISVISDGGQIHPHLDRYPYHDQHNAKHLRCNIMVSKENNSANPVICGQAIDVAERALWAFFPSEAPHATQEIQCRQPRIVFQFGFMVPNSYRLPTSV